MLRRLLPLLAIVAPVSARSQSPSATPYTRYATAIATKADSVVGFLTAEVDSLSNEVAVATLAARAAQMQRLTDEFVVTAPPADLAAVHQELVAALNLVAGKAAQAAALMRTALDSTNTDEQRTSAALTAQQDLQDLPAAIGSYQRARARAAQVLEQHGATLAGPR